MPATCTVSFQAPPAKGQGITLRRTRASQLHSGTATPRPRSRRGNAGNCRFRRTNLARASRFECTETTSKSLHRSENYQSGPRVGACFVCGLCFSQSAVIQLEVRRALFPPPPRPLLLYAILHCLAGASSCSFTPGVGSGFRLQAVS